VLPKEIDLKEDSNKVDSNKEDSKEEVQEISETPQSF